MFAPLRPHPVALARLAYPFAILRHAPPDDYDAATLAWVCRYRLADKDGAKKFERIICGTAARYGFFSASERVVQLAADLISWLFLFDDAYPEGRFRYDANGLEQACERYAVLLEGYPHVKAHSTFAEALLDLYQRMQELAPEAWLQRFIASLRYYFSGVLKEAHLRQAGVTPTVAEYLELRRASFGYAPVCDLMELISGDFLTQAERWTPDVVRLRTLGVDISAYVNDLYSYEKERASGDVCNMVHAVEANEGLPYEKACERVGQLHNEALGALLLLEARLNSSGASPAVTHLARSIREWSQGHNDWSIRCRRYDPRHTLDADTVRAAPPPRALSHSGSVPRPRPSAG
jgi:hypothetical protein